MWDVEDCPHPNSNWSRGCNFPVLRDKMVIIHVLFEELSLGQAIMRLLHDMTSIVINQQMGGVFICQFPLKDISPRNKLSYYQW